MEAITLKIDKTMLKNIDKRMKRSNYSTRTEFIRDSIRDKLEMFERAEALRHIMKFYGKSKTKTSDEELEQMGEEAVIRLAKRKGWDLD